MKKYSHIIYMFALMLLVSGCSHPSRCTSQQEKIVVYQVLTRLFGSDRENPFFDGDLSVNGVGKFEDFTTTALDSIRAMGMTHIWYTGVIEHASIYSIDTVGGIQKNHPRMIKGKAGSPYAIKDYYDVNAYLASDPEMRMAEFEALLERSHTAGLKVLIDFVPNHVARGYHSDVAPRGVEDFGASDDTSLAFLPNNNFYYIPSTKLSPLFDTDSGIVEYYEYPAKVTGNDLFSPEPKIEDWYETIKLNYGVDYQSGHTTHFDPIPDTWFKMRDILHFWARKGVDGFRCDMAEMTPVEFWGWVIKDLKSSYPEMIFIAEIYNPQSYESYITEGRFDYLYDKVGLYDTLKSIIQGHSPTSAISENRASIAHVQPYMLNFLENHDEQRIAWHEFAGSAQAGIPMMLVSTLSDNIPMMIYFGQELGEASPEATGFSGADGRTTIFDFWSVPSLQAWRNDGRFDGAGLSDEQRKLRGEYISILKMAGCERAFLQGEFIDLTLLNAESNRGVYAFMRRCDEQTILVVANFTEETQAASYQLPEGCNMELARRLFAGAGSTIQIGAEGVVSVIIAPYDGLVVSN